MEPRDVAQEPILEPRWLDVDAAASYLCLSRHALYHRVSRRQIPFVLQGRMIRFDRCPRQVDEQGGAPWV